MPRRSAARPDGRAGGRRRRVTAIVVSAVVLVVLVAAGWVAVRALQAKGALESALADAGRAESALKAGDAAGAQTAIAALARHSGAAQDATGDPVWWTAEQIPVLGANLTAVRLAATGVHTLAVEVAAPLLRVSTVLRQHPDGALVDLQALRRSLPTLEHAQHAVREVRGALSGAPAGGLLLPPLRAGLDRLAALAAQAEPAVGALVDASRLAPSLLGADGPRTILMVVQNNAELRTGGGITAAFLQLRAEGGRLTLVGQGSSSDFSQRATPILAVPAALDALYTSVAGKYVQNTSITPDFSLTARLASAWWQQRFGVTPDVVASVDPMVLKAILGVTGAIQTPQGPLTADDVVQRLLIDPYRTLSSEQQNVVFQAAAGAVFSRLAAGGVDPIRLAEALAVPVAEGRVSLWSARADEERLLAAGALAGPAARQRAAGPQAYAVYFNDVTGAKMAPYLGVRIADGVASCRADGRRTVTIDVTLRNTAPADAGSSWPLSTTGGGIWGIAAGHIATSVTVAAPAGSYFGGVTVDGTRVAPVDVDDDGFTASATQVDLAPGQSATIRYTFIAAQPGAVQPVMLHTPLIGEPELATLTPRCG